MFQKYTSNVSNVKTLVDTIDTLNNNVIDKIIGDNRGNIDKIILNLATLPDKTLKEDIKNPYYIKLAIAKKKELAAESKANYVNPDKVIRELKKITKEKNFAYKRKKQYNIKNGIKPWEK